MSTDLACPMCGTHLDLALLNHVASHGPCTGGELLHKFCRNPASREDRHLFSNKLGYLVYSQQLSCQGRGGMTGRYTLGPEAVRCTANAANAAHEARREAAKKAVRATAPIAPADSLLPQHQPTQHTPTSTATPPAINVMRSPTYVPGCGPALRPGALDYQRIPSHGHRC